MSRVNHGTVDLEIDGEDYHLRPTLDAYRKIQVRFGGLRGALEALTQINIEHLAHIVAAGSGKGRKQIPEIEEAIFNQGVGDVTEGLTPFVMALFNPRGEEEPGNERAGSE